MDKGPMAEILNNVARTYQDRLEAGLCGDKVGLTVALIVALKAGAAALRREQWRPIEEAPKDGTWVLCAWKNSLGRWGTPVSLYYHRDGCWTYMDPALTPIPENVIKPTHFRELPAPPEGL